MRKSTILATVTALLIFASIGWAQNASEPIPDATPDILGPQLIAWTQMQQPKPVPPPEPLPERQPEAPPQAQQPAQPPDSNPQPQPPEAQPGSQESAKTFTGTIVKQAGSYVLRSADLTYQLDDQDKAREFVGKPVKVIGTLDGKSNMIHVASIVFAS